jgi:hypothetical protein
MCARPDKTYEQEEAELVEEFCSGEMRLEELEQALAELRRCWKDIEDGRY